MTERVEERTPHRPTRMSDKTCGRSSENIRRERKLRSTSIFPPSRWSGLWRRSLLTPVLDVVNS